MAGKTYTEQINIPPASANSLTADGEGMHSAIPHGLVRGLNNLGTYVNNHWHYVQGSPVTSIDVHGRFQNSWTGGTREAWLLEIPILVPLWAYHMVWTIGARCVAVSMSAVTVYLSRTPYSGVLHTDPFDTDGFTGGVYSTVSSSVSLTAGQYSLVNQSAGGIIVSNNSTRLISPGTGLQTKRLGYVTVTGTGGTNATVAVDDCSFWFLPT